MPKDVKFHYLFTSSINLEHRRSYSLSLLVVWLIDLLLIKVEKVEKFKRTQATEDALHAKFNRGKLLFVSIVCGLPCA